MSKELPNFVLPSSLVSKVDLAHLIREVEAVDGSLEVQKVRGYKKEQYRLPAVSHTLTEFLTINRVDIFDDHTRMIFKEQLRIMKDKIPVMHLTFSAPADPESLEYLTAWIRKELHPQALITVGLQPSLIGGVYIRTPNHVHDYSMRALFNDKTSVIVNDLESLEHAKG
jgi:F0F1-type ATP synthase delta subunit